MLFCAEVDPALCRSLTCGLERWVPDLQIQYVPDCGHWVQNEAPQEVNEQLIAFVN